MNRCVRVCAGLIWGLGVMAVPAAAQVPAMGTSIPAADKNAPNAVPFRNEIRAFIHTEITALTGEDAAAQKAARDKLISECAPGSTPSFFDVYSQELNAEAMQVLAGNAQLRVRLNLAVVIEAVAKAVQAGSTVGLEPAIMKLIADPTDAVALLGMKAAKPTLVVILNVQNANLLAGDKLIPAIVAGVKAHPQFGFVTYEAYNALIPQPKGVGGNQIQTTLGPVFTPLLDILDYRISLYATAVVDQPSAEALVLAFFKPVNLASASKLERDRVNQSLTNLIYVAGEQAPFATKRDLEQIIYSLQYAAQQLNVILQNPAAANALTPLFRPSPGTKGDAIQKKTHGIPAVMQTIITTLKAPPTVTPATTESTTPAS